MANSGEINEFDIFVAKSIFPDASSVFAAWLKPLAEIKDRAVIVLDTNALLVPYNIGKESLKQIDRTYRGLVDAGRLVIPGQVAREFARNRAQKIAELYQQLKRKRDGIPNLRKGKYPLLEGVEVYQEALQLEEQIDELLRRYKDVLKNVLNHIQDWMWNDPVSLLYSNLFTEQVILDLEYDQDEIVEDLKRRQLHHIPPGYKDAGKEDSGVGDLLIWHTILKIGEQKKTDVIFVSGDQKSDWWHRSEGIALYPRYELVDEFRRASNGSSFHIIAFSKFLDLYGASEEIIKEVRAEEERQQEFFSLIGEFVRKWQQLEHTLLAVHRDLYPQSPPKWVSVSGIITQWRRDGIVSEEFAYRVKELNRFRNTLLHQHTNFPTSEIQKKILQIEDLQKTVWGEINSA